MIHLRLSCAWSVFGSVIFKPVACVYCATGCISRLIKVIIIMHGGNLKLIYKQVRPSVGPYFSTLRMEMKSVSEMVVYSNYEYLKWLSLREDFMEHCCL
jgi:hypothetical protein